MASIAFLPLFLLLAILAPQVSYSLPKCRVNIFRVTGMNDNLFTLACRCEGDPGYGGRTFQRLDPHKPDTIAQEKTTVRCLEYRREEMRAACAKNGTYFAKVARPILKYCVNRPPKNPTPETLVPFDFNKDKCSAELREVDLASGDSEVFLVCGCEQRPGYVVHPGAVQFITVGSPNGARAERILLRECAFGSMDNLKNTCLNHPDRFNLRASQMLNVCCKRARVRFAIDKLKCQASVPDDITTITFSYE